MQRDRVIGRKTHQQKKKQVWLLESIVTSRSTRNQINGAVKNNTRLTWAKLSRTQHWLFWQVPAEFTHCSQNPQRGLDKNQGTYGISICFTYILMSFCWPTLSGIRQKSRRHWTFVRARHGSTPCFCDTGSFELRFPNLAPRGREMMNYLTGACQNIVRTLVIRILNFRT